MTGLQAHGPTPLCNLIRSDGMGRPCRLSVAAGACVSGPSPVFWSGYLSLSCCLPFSFPDDW